MDSAMLCFQVVREEPPLLPVLPTHSPIVARPSPVAIKIIERFLHEKKLRLIDLFKSFDKNKTWLVSGNDFKKAIKKVANILLAHFNC